MGRQMFDQYSLLHAATGIIAYFWGMSRRTFMLVHIVFELFENTSVGMRLINIIPFWPGGKSYADSFINSMIGDNIAALIGHVVAQILDEHGSRAGWFERHI